MKKLLSTVFILLASTTYVFAQTPEIGNIQNKNTKEINITHNGPIYVKRGQYTYMFDRFGTVLGYFRKTPSGKVIAYDKDGNRTTSYKATPGGNLHIYNALGNRIN